MSILNFIFIPKSALNKIAESTSFNVCKSYSFTNYQYLLKFLLINLYFTTAIKGDSVITLLRDIFQAYLWCLRRFYKGIIKDFEAPNLFFCRSHQLIIHCVFGTSSVQQLAVVLLSYEVSTDIQTTYFKVKQLNSKILMQCNTKDLSG